MMEVKEEQRYLGDLLYFKGEQSKNIQARKNKGLGVTNRIMQILQTNFYGKYYFEVALVLRESLFLSSLLLNSEAWVNISDQDMRKLKQLTKFCWQKYWVVMQILIMFSNIWSSE